MKLPTTLTTDEDIDPEEFKVVRMTTKHHKRDCPSSRCPINLRRARKSVSKTNPLCNVVDQRTVMRILKYRPHLSKNGKIIWRQDGILIDNLIEAEISVVLTNRYYNGNNVTKRSALFQILDENGQPATDFTWAKERLASLTASQTRDFYEPTVARPVFCSVSSLEEGNFSPGEDGNPRILVPDTNVAYHSQISQASDISRGHGGWVPIEGNTPSEVYYRWPEYYLKGGYAGLHNKEYSEQSLTAHELSRISRRLMRLGWYTKR